MNLPSFDGTPEQRTLAEEVFRLMIAQGAFFADDAPIRQTLSNLADFFSQRHQRDRSVVVEELDAALSANSQVFQREQRDDEVTYITSRLGSFQGQQEDNSHTFAERLYQPETPLPIDDISVVVSTSRPALTTVEPVFISDYWQEQAGLVPTSGNGDDTLPAAMQPAPAEIPAALESSVPEPADLSAIPGFEAAYPPPAAAADRLPEIPLPWTPSEQKPEEVLAATDGPGQEEATEAAVIEERAPAAISAATSLVLVDGSVIDLARPVAELMAHSGGLLKEKLLEYIDHDPLRRIVRFGNMVYTESDLVNLGKNDLRRIRDDIVEAGEPLLDTTIISDLYYHSQRQQDYEGFRFSLNYRLHREKDFEFVGVEGAWLWSVRGLPAIGSKRVKASEMAQMTSYLVEGYDDSLQKQSAEAIQQSGATQRILSFFEWSYGILVLDDSLQALLPPPMLPEQRSAVLRIESPQHYASYLVEVRYPTINRGGWVQGLEDFFQEHLIPGGRINLQRSEEPHVFTITYEETPGNIDRLLTLDEKKNKFAFTDIEYYCAVDDALLLKQQRFGRLKNLKSLPTTDRRKADLVLQHVFEVMGDQVGNRQEPSYQADVDTLWVAYNVLRPASRPFLESLLAASDTYVADESLPGIYTYTPEPEPQDNAATEEEDTIMQWNYDDDE